MSQCQIHTKDYSIGILGQDLTNQKLLKDHQLIELGKFNELTILRKTSVGLFLGDEDGEEVLLPNKYCPDQFVIGNKLKVFIYLDYAERKIATNLIPRIFLHEFALLRVTDVNEFGAFMDWGLEKDLMVPFSEQRQKMEEGRSYIVFLDIDWKSERLFASNKLEKHLQNEFLEVEEGDQVQLIIQQKTDLGYSVIVNNSHRGLIYDSEIFIPLHIGDRVDGFIKKIRDDNKLDISLHPIGYENARDQNTQIIYQALLDQKGILDLTDKSSPEEISHRLGMSKKAFKKAIGALYKERKIRIQEDGIHLA